MLSKQSPSGAMFPYYYKNGELFGMHLESYGSNDEGLVAMMKAEEAFFLQQNRTIGIWLNFYGTDLTDRALAQLIEMISALQARISRLSLVGCSFWDRRKINRLIRRSDIRPSLPVRYFSDPEVAKTWLVSERV